MGLKSQRAPLQYSGPPRRTCPSARVCVGACFMQAPLAKTQLSLHSFVMLQELDIKVEFPSSQGSSVKISH